MSKRAADSSEQSQALHNGERPMKDVDNDEVGHFEDEHEDEFESEDEIIEAGVDGRPDEEREAEEVADCMDVDNDTFIPGRNKLSPGEVLSPDASSYHMLHSLDSTWPCLSLDILKDNLGSGRARKVYPATIYAVAGTQAAAGQEKENKLMVMKLSGLSKMDRPDDDSDAEDSDDEDTDPILETKDLPLTACTNRIRAKQEPPSDPTKPGTALTASMAETGHVYIHDITPHLTAFDTPGFMVSPQQSQPIHTIKAHRSTEGYAVDWSQLHPQGRLATGDTAGSIFVTTRSPAGDFTTDSRPFTGHTSSVEELQWSPSEPNVFASASSDGTVKIWDLRSKAHKPAISVQVSNTDVNVLSWSHLTSYLLASGADDGQWAVWDLRQWKPTAGGSGGGSSGQKSIQSTPLASFDFHKEQVTSVEWHPTDDSTVAVAAGDNTITLWDLSVELDDAESRDTAGVKDVPPQLLFVHYMDQVKECHWHPQIPGCIMATGGSGFGAFKTISV